jgi:allantoin racemase
MRILVVNGNRTDTVTERAVAEARHCAAPGTEIVGMSSAFGANIVSTVADNTVAAHAVLDTLARHWQGFDAAILAISLDSGLAAARQLFPIPVVGMTEAALHTAALLGDQFGMITFGQQTRALYLDIVAACGLTRRLADCRTIDTVSLTAYLDPAAMETRIVEEACDLARAPTIASVIVCGAALAGVPRRLQSRVPAPLVDGVACAVRMAELLVRSGYPRKPPTHPAAPDMQGIGAELAARFRTI